MRRSAHFAAKHTGSRIVRVRGQRAHLTISALSLVVILLTACAGSAGTSPPVTATNVPEELTRPAPHPSLETRAPEDGVTINGTVMDASPSAKVIRLEKPDQGITTIALTDATELLAASGESMTLTDVFHGDHVTAHGREGTPGTLLANRIVVEPP